MERGLTLEQGYELLLERLKFAANNSSYGKDTNEQRRIDHFDFWPSKNMKISELAPMETYIRLVESVSRFQLAKSLTKAKNSLSYSVQLARLLDDQLPGNDEAVRFFSQGNEYLEGTNIKLAEDVSRIMFRVFDEKRFTEQI